VTYHQYYSSPTHLAAVDSSLLIEEIPIIIKLTQHGIVDEVDVAALDKLERRTILGTSLGGEEDKYE